MSFFEKELRKILKKQELFSDVRYAGRSCFGIMDKETKAKIQFVTLSTADKYEALKVEILNQKEGKIDSIIIRFKDLFGKKAVDNPNFKEGIVPHIWTYHDRNEWYAYKPNELDYEQMYESIAEYISVFQTQEEEQTQSPQMC